jgi:cell division protease FtsH
MFPKAAVWLIVAVVLFTVFRSFETTKPRGDSVAFSQFMQSAKDGQIASAEIDGRTIRARTRDGKDVVAIQPPSHIWTVDDLMKSGVVVTGKAEQESSLLQTILINWFPMLLLIAVWLSLIHI